MYYYSGVGGLLVLALDIYCLYLIFTDRGRDTGKLLWVIIVVLLPIIGPVLYLLLGRGRSTI